MENILRSMFLLSCTIFYACSEKECCDPPPSIAPNLVKSQIQSYPSIAGIPDVVTAYYYDSFHRLVLTKISTGDSLVFEYAGTNVMEKQFGPSGILNTSNTYLLNDRGLVDSSVEDNGTKFTKASYDLDGFLTELKIYDHGGNLKSIQHHIYINGSESSITTQNASGMIEYSQFFLYTAGRPNTLKNENKGQAYFGTSSNFLATTVIRSDKVLNKNDTVQYTYDLDAKGRIIHVQGKQDSLITKTSYSYYE